MICRYDLKAKKDFAKEMKLAGAVSDVKYVITHAIGKGTTAVTLATKQAGHVLKAIGDTSDMLTKLSATGSADVAGVDIAYEPSYLIKKQVLATKVTLNAALGAGVSAMAAVTATSSGDVSANYELGYGASLGEVSPARARAIPTKHVSLSTGWLLPCVCARRAVR